MSARLFAEKELAGARLPQSTTLTLCSNDAMASILDSLYKANATTMEFQRPKMSKDGLKIG